MAERHDIEFTSGSGAVLRGWSYPAGDGAPCVVVQHGFAAVKEMHLDDYAEVFQAAGLSCLVYDHPGFGASDAVPGQPRQEIDPWVQVRHIQEAITYAASLDHVDGDRIGLWGSSYGAANAYVTAAIDRRVKAVVGQVPLISGSRAFASLVRIDLWDQMDALFAADRQARMAGQPPMTIPVVDPDPMAQSALPTADSHAFFTQTAAERAPSFVNEVTARTLEMFRGYEPGAYLPLIAPTPLLMVLAPRDRLVAGEWSTAAYETAAHPKRIELLDGGHFDAYTGEGFARSSTAARDWFVEHLIEHPNRGTITQGT
ncbi:MAG: alpha/beta hydrolase [Solirubrobacteraceae bacterium]